MEVVERGGVQPDLVGSEIASTPPHSTTPHHKHSTFIPQKWKSFAEQ